MAKDKTLLIEVSTVMDTRLYATIIYQKVKMQKKDLC